MPARRYYVNGAPQRTTNASIGSSDTSVSVSGTFAGWPTQFPFFAVFEYGKAGMEIVSVTDISAGTATIVRGQGGTSAVSHAAGVTLDFSFVAQDFDEANAHTSSNAGVHGVSGNVVGTTDTQTLTNKTVASPTLTGTVNATGVTFTGAPTIDNPTLVSPSASNPTLTGTVDASSATVNTQKVTGDGTTPVGSITMYGGAAAPSGWLLCDGSAVSRTTYAALFGVVGTTFGTGDGSTTFNLPDLRQRFPRGADTGSGNTLGSKAGTGTHNHGLSTGVAYINYNDVFIRSLEVAAGYTANQTRNLTGGSLSTASTGASTATALGGNTTETTVTPPYTALNFIIKT